MSRRQVRPAASPSDEEGEGRLDHVLKIGLSLSALRITPVPTEVKRKKERGAADSSTTNVTGREGGGGGEGAPLTPPEGSERDGESPTFSEWRQTSDWKLTLDLVAATPFYARHVTPGMTKDLGPLFIASMALERIWKAWKDDVTKGKGMVLSFNNRCARCFRVIDTGEALGGGYDGVICTMHRSCSDCWFEAKSDYGKRKDEPATSKDIALVDKPRKEAPICFGCFYRVPYHVDGANNFCIRYFSSIARQFKKDYNLKEPTVSRPRDPKANQFVDDDDVVDLQSDEETDDPKSNKPVEVVDLQSDEE